MNLKFKFKYQMKNFNYLIDHILYQIFKNLLSISLKKSGEKTINPSIRIYVNITENKITFKTGYLKLQTHEIMEILGSNKSNITKIEHCENVSHLEINEVVLSLF